MSHLSKPPCTRCGYNGPGYFQPATHPCAAQSAHGSTKATEPDFRALYAALVDRIDGGHKQSIGSINNIRMVRFDIDEIARMRAHLSASHGSAPEATAEGKDKS